MPLAKNHGAFEDILQFANVPWVLIALQHGPRIGIQFGSRLAELLGKPCNGPPAQRQDVCDPLPERGNRKGHDMKAKIEILAKGTTPYILLQVAVRCRNQTKIHSPISGGAESPERRPP